MIKHTHDHTKKHRWQKQMETKGGEELHCFTTTQACVAGEARMRWSTTHVKSNKLLETRRHRWRQEAHLGALKVEQREVLITET